MATHTEMCFSSVYDGFPDIVVHFHTYATFKGYWMSRVRTEGIAYHTLVKRNNAGISILPVTKHPKNEYRYTIKIALQDKSEIQNLIVHEFLHVLLDYERKIQNAHPDLLDIGVDLDEVLCSFMEEMVSSGIAAVTSPS